MRTSRIRRRKGWRCAPMKPRNHQIKTDMNTHKEPLSLPASDLFAVLSPVIDWYQSDEQPAREPLDIIRDIVADLQIDRNAALVASSAARDALALCHQIERCGCSEELTQASIMASDLRAKLASANAKAEAPSLSEVDPLATG